ncbi:rho GTPase-activating protein 35-like [Sycon ciliatum]|uniref:rho GTPase-activating protein 35-like n=1 Tax=Sycon ciliatum TaxID=27933 RepID=UPI0031F612FA
MASSGAKAAVRCRVSVLGLSGKDKGQLGVGKSCLCNRFVRPSQNEFREDHISQFGNSDWMSLVINQQHFLYWGPVDKRVGADSERTVTFEVVEQTEFEDDSSFKPFGVSGSNTYLKRAASTKLVSSGKLMYINKDQVALPTDYPVENLPQKFAVDGFLVVFDVSKQQYRAADSQLNLLTKLLPILHKQKKPIVVAATKCDELSEKLLEDLEAAVAKSARGVHIVQTSASEGVNVDAAFFLLEQLQTQRSSRSLARVPTFAEGARVRQEEKEAARRVFQRLLEAKVSDFRVTWNRAQKILNGHEDFEQFVSIAGSQAAKRAVLQFVRRLQSEKRAERLTHYQQLLPDVLLKVLSPDARGKSFLVESGSTSWEEAKELLREMAEFERHFVVLPDDCHWHDDENLVSTDVRIPADILNEEFAKNSFDSLRRKAQLKADQEEVAGHLRALLNEWQNKLSPGMDWTTSNQILMNHPRYKQVPETVALPTFEKFEQELRESCRNALGELLLERIELFDSFSSANAQATNEHIQDLESQLKNEPQYTRLDMCPSDRSTVLWNTVAACHRPHLNGDVCHAIGRLHSEKTWMLPDYKWFLAPDDHHINVVLLGMDQLPHELNKEIEGCKSAGRIRLSHHEDNHFDLTVKIINSSPLSADSFIDDDFAPQGIIGVFSSPESVEYLQRVLNGIMLHAPLQSALDPVPFRGLPCALVNAVDHHKPEVDHLEVEANGQRLAYRLQCPVISGRTKEDGKRVTALQAIEAVSSLVNGIKHRHTSLYSLPSPEPDLKIALCCLANDQIVAERILGPFLRHQCCWRPATSTSGYTDTLYFEMCFGRSMRLVQVKVHSSMSVEHITKDLKHGILIVHSAARKASLVVARRLLRKLPAIPKALVAVTTAEVTEEESPEFALLSESNQSAASSSSAQAVTAGPSFQFDEVAFTDFLNETWDRHEASVQTQTAPVQRPRCNTPPAGGGGGSAGGSGSGAGGMTRSQNASSSSLGVRTLPSGMSRSDIHSVPLVHKRAVFDDMEVQSSSSSSFRSPARPHSMSFETPSRSSMDFSTDSSSYDTEYTTVPGTTTGFVFSATPGRTSPRPHARKSSTPAALSQGSSVEAIGETHSHTTTAVPASRSSGLASVLARGLGTLPRARRRTSQSPSTTSHTSDSGNDDSSLLAAGHDHLESSNPEAFYADPADSLISKRRQPGRRPKISSSSSLPLGGSIRSHGQASNVSSVTSGGLPTPDLEEYATPADARTSLASTRSSVGSTSTAPAAASTAAGFVRPSSDLDDYADPWDIGPGTRPASESAEGTSSSAAGLQSGSAQEEYMLPADVMKTSRPPSSPLVSNSESSMFSSLTPKLSSSSMPGEEYAMPADVMPKKSPAASVRGDRNRPKKPTARVVDDYAFPHDVLKPKPNESGKSSTLPQHFRTGVGAAAIKPPTSKPPPLTKPSPNTRSKPWASLSLRKSPSPAASKPPVLPRHDSSPRLSSDKPLIPPKDMASLRDTFASISKDIPSAVVASRESSTSSPLVKARQRPPKPVPAAKPSTEARLAAARDSSNQSMYTMVVPTSTGNSTSAAAAGASAVGASTQDALARSSSANDADKRVALSPVREQISGITTSGSSSATAAMATSTSAHQRHPIAERRSSGQGSVASSGGSDSVLSSEEDDLPTVSRSQLQRNATGLREAATQSGAESGDLSIAHEVERLYALSASQVGPNSPPPAPPLPDIPLGYDGYEVKHSLEEEIRRRRKNSLNKIQLVKMNNQPMVDGSDSEDEPPPPVPPRLYSFSESEEDEENLNSSSLEISTKSTSSAGGGGGGGEGKVSTLMRKALQRQKLSKEEKEKRRAEREIRREEKKRKTKKWKKEEVERLRQEANARYVRIFKTSLQESPTRSEEALVPMFVEVCVEFIEANGITFEGLYRVSGNKLEVDHLREQYAYAPGVAVCNEASCITVVTSALKSFFHMLPEPLIPTSLYADLAAAIDTTEDAEVQAAAVRSILLSAMPAKELAVLTFMVQHLYRVSLNSQENKMTSRNLSIVFAPNFTQPPLDNFSTSLTSSLSQVVALMISQCHLVFGTTGSAAGRTGTGSTPTREAPSAGLSSASAASLTSDSAARGAPLPAYEVVSLSNPGSRPPSVTDSHPSIATASTSAGSSPKLPRRSPSQKSPAPSASANPPEEIEMYGRTPVWGAR